MSIVNSIETVRDWLTAEVCPLVKLKLPDDKATDASYPYKLVNPAAFSLFVPSKDRTPPNIAAPIPSVCVQLVQGDDRLIRSARSVKIRLLFSAWDPGYHGPDIYKPKGDGSGSYVQQYNEAAAAYFVKNGEGWRDDVPGGLKRSGFFPPAHPPFHRLKGHETNGAFFLFLPFSDKRLR